MNVSILCGIGVLEVRELTSSALLWIAQFLVSNRSFAARLCKIFG
jgi:hypothetical protein